MVKIDYQHTCGYCEHFTSKTKEHIARWYCKAHGEYLRKGYAININGCSDFTPELFYKTKQDIIDAIYDEKCGGCEYSEIDEDGCEGPSFSEDSGCGHCCMDLNEVISEIHNGEDINLLIRRYSYGNDKTEWQGFYFYSKGVDEDVN